MPCCFGAKTVSCYQADAAGNACGACDACRIREPALPQPASTTQRVTCNTLSADGNACPASCTRHCVRIRPGADIRGRCPENRLLHHGRGVRLWSTWATGAACACGCSPSRWRLRAPTRSTCGAGRSFRVRLSGAALPWLAYIVGGLLFGVGMTLGSGCGSRSLIRIGGGNLKSLVVYVFLAHRGVHDAARPVRASAHRKCWSAVRRPVRSGTGPAVARRRAARHRQAQRATVDCRGHRAGACWHSCSRIAISAPTTSACSPAW